MSWLLAQLGHLFQLLLVVLVLLALLSPFETLGWWAGWFRREGVPPEPVERPSSTPESARHYVVYLTGVAGFSPDFLSRRERRFLKNLESALPDTVTVSDVFPFSVNNNPLDGDRVLAWLWAWLHRRRLKVPHVIYDVLIVLRNIW